MNLNLTGCMIKASDFFHGKEKYNCAQAILKFFQEDYKIEQSLIDKYKKKGGGRAEGGVCGALHASYFLIKNKEMTAMADKHFADEAGSIVCKEIKRAKKLSCEQCVDLAERILHDMEKKIAAG